MRTRTDDLVLRLKAVTQILEAATTLTPVGLAKLADDFADASSLCRVLAAGVTDSGSVIETRHGDD